MKENDNGNDTNVGSIEDIARIAKLITTKFNNDYSIDNRDKEAIEHILSDYKRVLEENEEYSKQLDLDYVDKNYIPKQKIKAKIEELNKTINKGGIIYSLKQCARCQKDVLEKLLIEESED